MLQTCEDFYVSRGQHITRSTLDRSQIEFPCTCDLSAQLLVLLRPCSRRRRIWLFGCILILPSYTGVCSVDEHFAEWIVARERVGRIVPYFHIAMEMSLSSSNVGESYFYA